MFSATVITGMSMKCWCTMPMPLAIASRGDDMRTGSPSIRISPSIRVVEAVEDVHERRLSGAVLAEERVDLATTEVEVDVVVREHPGELLRDPAELENRGFGRHVRRF